MPEKIPPTPYRRAAQEYPGREGLREPSVVSSARGGIWIFRQKKMSERSEFFFKKNTDATPQARPQNHQATKEKATPKASGSLNPNPRNLTKGNLRHCMQLLQLRLEHGNRPGSLQGQGDIEMLPGGFHRHCCNPETANTDHLAKALQGGRFLRHAAVDLIARC
ncbi:hypothetical protein MARINON1_20262 [Marinobacter salarius]|nr:hypothetical protein MBHK15_90263 [Marinobacter salarius]VXB00870.1 hypothetical protein MARINON1_20262 [Marinobacter salarius]